MAKNRKKRLKKMKALIDWRVDREALAWAPEGGLAIPVKAGEKEIDWETYLSRLSHRMEWMSRNLEEAEDQYPEAWKEVTGQLPDLGRRGEMSDHPQTEEFQEVLADRTQIHWHQLPMKVTPSKEAAEEIDGEESPEAFQAEQERAHNSDQDSPSLHACHVGHAAGDHA